jgi:hypothetical protein
VLHAAGLSLRECDILQASDGRFESLQERLQVVDA